MTENEQNIENVEGDVQQQPEQPADGGGSPAEGNEQGAPAEQSDAPADGGGDED